MFSKTDWRYSSGRDDTTTNKCRPDDASRGFALYKIHGTRLKAVSSSSPLRSRTISISHVDITFGIRTKRTLNIFSTSFHDVTPCSTRNRTARRSPAALLYTPKLLEVGSFSRGQLRVECSVAEGCGIAVENRSRHGEYIIIRSKIIRTTTCTR